MERALVVVANWLNDGTSSHSRFIGPVAATNNGEWMVARLGAEEIQNAVPNEIRFFQTVKPIIQNLLWIERFTKTYCWNTPTWVISIDNVHGAWDEFSSFWNRIQNINGNDFPDVEPNFYLEE
jgi:hypothetical protein